MTKQTTIVVTGALRVKYSVKQKIPFNGSVFGKKCCHCNEGSLCKMGENLPSVSINSS